MLHNTTVMVTVAGCSAAERPPARHRRPRGPGVGWRGQEVGLCRWYTRGEGDAEQAAGPGARPLPGPAAHAPATASAALVSELSRWRAPVSGSTRRSLTRGARTSTAPVRTEPVRNAVDPGGVADVRVDLRLRGRVVACLGEPGRGTGAAASQPAGVRTSASVGTRKETRPAVSAIMKFPQCEGLAIT